MADVQYSGKQMYNGGKVNPDLQKERDTVSFDVNTLKYFLNGGEDEYKKKVHIANILFKEPCMRLDYDNVVSDVDRYQVAYKRTNKLVNLAMEHGWGNEELETAFQLTRVGLTIGVHGGMFIPAIERLGTPEQQEKWLPKAYSLQILGTYCQTELGHGTNLRGLEAVAKYDPSTEEFILNTGKISGMKWWPGGLGKTCNHVLLLAQLEINGQSHGMQPFMVQIRDMDTHKPLPGVEVGEIGSRVGLRFTDNGFLILNNVRIPRMNMLMRNQQVTPEGKFISRVSSKATYGTMVMMRAKIVGWSYGYMSQAIAIATRYSAVRRQSELKPGAPEPQVLDYYTQQYKLFPGIAATYAVFFAKRFMLNRYEEVDQTEIKFNNFKSLPELHSMSCGLKSFCSELSVEHGEICRRSCGGHGYLITSGIAQVVLDSMAQVTYEGENTVLYLQTARYLMREFASIADGQKLSGTWSYLNERNVPATFNNPSDCDDLEQLANAFKRAAQYIIAGVSKQLQKIVASGKPQHDAWNEMSVHLVMATKIHMEAVMVITFVHSVKNLTLPENIRTVLRRLCVLYSLNRINVNAGFFLESGALKSEQMNLLRTREVELLSILRPDAVGLVDAFGHLDETLNAAIGSYDGNAYERLYAAAKRSAVNKYEVIPGFMEYMKPLQKLAKL